MIQSLARYYKAIDMMLVHHGGLNYALVSRTRKVVIPVKEEEAADSSAVKVEDLGEEVAGLLEDNEEVEFIFETLSSEEKEKAAHLEQRIINARNEACLRNVPDNFSPGEKFPKNKNRFLVILRSFAITIIGTTEAGSRKHITGEYKFESRLVCLRLLEELIDSDGYYDPRLNMYQFSREKGWHEELVL